MAAGGTINPLRQQMINMMYLVLMALLALNVSADILKAFALVNKGLDGNNQSYEQKSLSTMAQFDELLKVDKAGAQKYYNNALQARNVSEAMFNYLQSIKEIIAKRSGGWAPDSAKTTVIDDNNLEISTNYFLNAGHGQKLQDSLREYIKNMQGLLVNPGEVPIKIDVNEPPADKEGTKKSWSAYYWEGVPTVAALTELTKLQNDIRNAEAEVTNNNIIQVGYKDYKFDKMQAVISSETPVLSAGQSYEAKIFLGAISSTVVPKISVNGVPQSVVNGKVLYKEPASGGGTKDLNVSITVPNPRNPGHDTTYTTKTEYTVFTGASTLSVDKANILYIGIDNPISVSAAGFTPAQTSMKVSGGGRLRESSPGHFSFVPDGSLRDITATCYVRMSDGSTRQMGQPMKYRVRKVPNPEILIGPVHGGLISRAQIASSNQLNVALGEDFIYDGIHYKVNSYTIGTRPRSGVGLLQIVQGNKIEGNVKEKLEKLNSGEMIMVANVSVTGPMGNLVLPGSNFTVR